MDLTAAIEAILFISGEPVTIFRLAKLIQTSEEKIRESLEELAKMLAGRGITLLLKDDSAALATNPEQAGIVSKIAKEEFDRGLTRAALETLSIIIYNGPVTRPEIDFIRGVNSSFTIRNLMIRGLIERSPNPKDARAYLYRPSMQLLAFLGVEKLDSIPQFADFRADMDEYLGQLKIDEP